ncbi:MAG TPA: M50 family metallopeptidase [Nocardioides sp.]|nr:M50 family metallopeptidase [Nocardioides sp.]
MSTPSPAPRRPPAPRGMVRIGRIAGSDVLVSTSWFFVAALIAWIMGPRVDQVQPGLGGWKYVVGIAFAMALYLAILLHEASHAIVARRFGFRVEAITLHFLGGATTIDGEARRPRQEFWIAVVGPITSLLVGAGALGLWFLLPDDQGLLMLVIEGLAGSNLVIGVLNLVPGLPLDGGRVLKAGVWALTGKVHTGTVVAGWGGRVAALLVVVWAVLSAGDGAVVNPIVLTIVAVFLWTGAGQAIAAAGVVRGLSRVVARDLARPAVTVPEDLPLAEAVRRADAASVTGIVTTTSDGHPVGVVSEEAVRAVPQERMPWLAVSTVARSLAGGRALPVGISGDELLAALRRTPATEYVLIGEDGSIQGVLATADIVQAVRNR